MPSTLATRNLFRPIDRHRLGIVLTVLNNIPLEGLLAVRSRLATFPSGFRPFVLMRNSAQFLKAAYEGARLCRVSGESDLRFERQRTP